MEFYCEDRFNNIPPDVEFQLNGHDAGEYIEPSSALGPEDSGLEWDELARAIDKEVHGSNVSSKLPTIWDCTKAEIEELLSEIFNKTTKQCDLPDDSPTQKEEICHHSSIQPLLNISFCNPPFAQSPPESGYSSCSTSGQNIFNWSPTNYMDPTNQSTVMGMAYQCWSDDHLYRIDNLSPMKPHTIDASWNARDQPFMEYKRRAKKVKEQKPYCVFCMNNKEPFETYMSHSVKDARGNVTCPRLYAYVCPRCSASGNQAHTIKYCPEKPIITLEMTEMMNQKGHRRRAHPRPILGTS
ncbi:uncharacterized protein LOC129797679 [Lutzomyia longipalpis]|uniref:uncharacterized protein LOC129797679 n=1 Tax=Lutzomyia longipalpis TaxID=7200 RepID=UPI0024842CE6|nr:uncharacterized protein LOC129797679 [Lutzomyia longipalpis]